MGCHRRWVAHLTPSQNESRDDNLPEPLLIFRSPAVRHHSNGLRGIYHWPFRNIYPPPTASIRSALTRDADAIHQESPKRRLAGHHNHELYRQTTSHSCQSRRPVSRKGTFWDGKLRTRHRSHQLDHTMVFPQGR